jgi:hypothetical protein
MAPLSLNVTGEAIATALDPFSSAQPLMLARSGPMALPFHLARCLIYQGYFKITVRDECHAM